MKKLVYIAGLAHDETCEMESPNISEISNHLSKFFNDDFDYINLPLPGVPDWQNLSATSKAIASLGISLQYMAKADVVYLPKNWRKSRAAVNEHNVATSYGIDIIEADHTPIHVFISQPMKDKTDDEIKEERSKIMSYLNNEAPKQIWRTLVLHKGMYSNASIKFTLIDSFFESAPHDAKPLWYLGESFKLLSTADIAVFAKGWSDYRGCSMEYKAAQEYGIPIFEMP